MPLFDLKQYLLTVRYQNLIGSSASTHTTFNLIGPCNKHPKIQSHKDANAQTTDIWAIFSKWVKNMQLKNNPHVLHAKPSNKVYVFNRKSSFSYFDTCQSKSIKVSNRVTDFCRLISIGFLFLSTFKTIDMLCPVLCWMFTRAYSRETREENSHYKPNPQNNGLIHLSSIPNKELSYHYRLLQTPENFNYKITKIVCALWLAERPVCMRVYM